MLVGMDLLTGLERSSRRPRRPAPGVVAHAVPRHDRTRTALCGASVVVSATDAFDGARPVVCGECASLARPLARTA